MNKFLSWLGPFVKSHWLLIVGFLVAIVLLWFGQEVFAAILAALGLGGDQFTPNHKPKGRDEPIGVEDDKGIKQKPVDVVDDVKLDSKDTPDGVNDNDVDVVITSDVKVEVSDNDAELENREQIIRDARAKAKESRKKLNRILGE